MWKTTAEAAEAKQSEAAAGQSANPSRNLVTDPLLTIQDVARLLRMSQRWVYAAVRRGDIRGHKQGTRWLCRMSDLEAYVTAQQEEQSYRGRRGPRR